jgi:hypothetical protein
MLGIQAGAHTSDVTASKGTAHRCTLCAPQLRGGALRVLEVSEQRRTDLPIRLVVEAFQSKRRSENRVQPRLLCVRMNPRIHRASAMPQWPASMLREGDLMQKGRCIERGASVCGRVWWLGHCPQDTDPAQRFYAILDRLRHRTPQLRAAERGTAYIKSAARERVRGNTSTAQARRFQWDRRVNICISSVADIATSAFCGPRHTGTRALSAASPQSTCKCEAEADVYMQRVSPYESTCSDR